MFFFKVRQFSKEFFCCLWQIIVLLIYVFNLTDRY